VPQSSLTAASSDGLRPFRPRRSGSAGPPALLSGATQCRVSAVPGAGSFSGFRRFLRGSRDRATPSQSSRSRRPETTKTRPSVHEPVVPPSGGRCAGLTRAPRTRRAAGALEPPRRSCYFHPESAPLSDLLLAVALSAFAAFALTWLFVLTGSSRRRPPREKALTGTQSQRAGGRGPSASLIAHKARSNLSTMDTRNIDLRLLSRFSSPGVRYRRMGRALGSVSLWTVERQI